MAGPRTLAAMTPEQVNEKVEALSPAWAKDYIRQLEALTRTLHAQLTEVQEKLAAAQAQGLEDLNLAREISGARDRLAADLNLAREVSGAQDRLAGQAGPEEPGEEEWDPGLNGQPAASAPAGNGWLSGIEPPVEGRYAPVRIVNGAANMDPVADLDPRFEIRFADFYQVRYGDHDTTGGMRVLVIEGDGPIRINPVSQTTVIVSRGGSQ